MHDNVFLNQVTVKYTVISRVIMCLVKLPDELNITIFALERVSLQRAFFFLFSFFSCCFPFFVLFVFWAAQGGGG